MSVLSRSRTTAPADRQHRLHLPHQRPAARPLPAAAPVPTSSTSTGRAGRRRAALAAAALAVVTAATVGTWTLLDDEGVTVTTPGTTGVITGTEGARDEAAARRNAADRLADRLSTEGQRDAARAGVSAP